MVDSTSYHAIFLFTNFSILHAMKKLLSTLLAAALIAPAAANTQSAQIATLTHDGEVSLFNGSSGLIEAHKAAADGDIITLSPGTFTGTTITKHITIRGAGMFPEDNGTIINSDLTIKPTTVNDDQPITLEGLNMIKSLYIGTTNKIAVTKCSIAKYLSDRLANKITFLNSFIKSIDSAFEGDEITYINSVVLLPRCDSYGTYVFENCYIAYNYISLSYSTTVRNSLLKDTNTTGSSIVSYGIFVNNIVLSNNSSTLKGGTSVNNTAISPIPTDIWKDESRYVLTDENAKNWLGGDGTQVGIYGGMMPFDPTPSNPQITKFNVASKTSADGKLSVEIEVKSAE